MMSDSPADAFAQIIKPRLKELGFKKSGLNWRRSLPDLVHVVNIQRSQWGPEFYINLGVYITALGSDDQPRHNRCHIRARLPHDGKPSEQVLSEAEAWFAALDSMAALSELARQDDLPIITSAEARNYLGHNN